MKTFKTNNLFIDTSIFIQKNFDYRNSSFEKLKSIIKSDNLNLFITSITENEVKSNIKSEISKVKSYLKLFRNEGKILWNVNSFDFKTLFKIKSLDDYEKEIIDQFHNFLKVTNAKHIKINNARVDKVFQDYFENNAPFNSGKKKNEFPDAFVIEALKEWCELKNEKIYVLSDDGDFKDSLKSSNNLLYIKSLEEYLDLFNKFTNDLPDKILDILDRHNFREVITKDIEVKFPELVFWLNDEDGDVSDIDVKDVIIEDQYVIEAVNNSATIEFDAVINFSASISFFDSDRSMYDNEEGKYLFKFYLNGVVDRSVTVPIKVEVELDALKEEFHSIKDIVINNNRDVEISANRYEENYEEIED